MTYFGLIVLSRCYFWAYVSDREPEGGILPSVYPGGPHATVVSCAPALSKLLHGSLVQLLFQRVVAWKWLPWIQRRVLALKADERKNVPNACPCLDVCMLATKLLGRELWKVAHEPGSF